MARTKWLKRHSQDEIDRTRDHRMRERVVLNELTMMMDVYDGPIPYKIGAITARIQCADLPRQAVQASISALIDAGDVTIIDDGKSLVVPWVMDLISDRSERCAVNKRVAIDREAKRQLEASYAGPKVEHEAIINGATSETVNENKGGSNTNVPQTKNHHQTQNSEQEKHLDLSPETLRETQPGEVAGKVLSDSDFSIDDDRRARPLAPSLVRATEVACGSEERAAEIIAEYLGSDYGRNRQHDGAYVKWVAKTYGIQVSTRGSTFGPRQLAELCGTDAFGRPDPSLAGTREALAKRRGAAVAVVAAH